MKKLFNLMIVAAVMLLAIGCEGPTGPQGLQGPQGEQGIQGPAGADGADGADGTSGVDGVDGAPGADGADGVDGVDATSACLSCHNDDVLFEKRFELNQHDHAIGSAAAYAGGRSYCGPCHSHQQYLNAKSGTSLSLNTPLNFTCKTCHGLHDTDDLGQFEFGLRGDNPVTYLTGGTYDFDASSSPSSFLCINCHNPRRTWADYWYEDAIDTTGAVDSLQITSTHAGPHYGVTGELIFGISARDEVVAIENAAPMAHAAAGCVTCHMGDNYSHTFHPETDACNTACHTADPVPSDFDLNGYGTAAHDALAAIEDALVAIGVYELVDGELEQLHSRQLTEAEFEGAWNYFVLHSDHGSIYHNPAYVKSIINNIETNLGLTATTW